ncbi:hypothetical protein [Nonomuraea aurantiaca]|uniref:hypothetical protein n=1 Tax=Nonomuraea aurantiaca TaxID=2878562 RepID=UPI001CDA3411|nr:hypothetical protein [Nonomuraea aurantiaca]MCA2224252.1 hypothetical protein [Nonomuraea aurantiaca]
MGGAHEYRGEPERTPAQLILGFLDARDISVPEEARSRIRTCTDQSLLDRWTVRAVTALSVDELFS